MSYIDLLRCRLIYNQHYAPYEHIYICVSCIHVVVSYISFPLTHTSYRVAKGTIIFKILDGVVRKIRRKTCLQFTNAYMEHIGYVVRMSISRYRV